MCYSSDESSLKLENKMITNNLDYYKVCVEMKSKDVLTSNRVIGLDTLAAISIFKDSNDFIDKWKCSGVIVSGVNKNGKSIYVNTKGICSLGIEVYISSECVGNILSMGDIRDKCHSVEYQSDADVFKVQVYEYGDTYIFSRNIENLYTCDIDVDIEEARVMVEAVRDKMKMYSKREIRDAIRAREIQRQLGFMRAGELQKMISNGKIKNCDIGKKDVRRAEDIFE